MPYGRRGSEFVVNNQLAGSQITPSVAGFAAGGFIVVWSTTDTAQDGAGRSIKAQRYDSNGVPIGAEMLINTAAAGDQRAPSVTTLASGGYVITWETSDTSQDGSGTAIKGQLFNSAGAAVGAEFRVNSQLVADQTKSFVTGLEGGGFVVTWQTADSTQDGHTSAIKGQIYSASGAAVGGEFLVNTGAVGAESSPSVTSLAGGGFVATWTLGGGQQADVYAQVFTSSGAKSGGQFIVSTTNALNQDSTSVSHISGGRFVVTWTSASSLNTGDVEIRARLFSASGTPIGSDFAVSTTRTDAYTGGPVFASNPSVVDLANGGFLITWTIGGDAPGSSVRGQYFDSSGARVGGEVLISTVTDRIESASELAVDGNGNIFSVWSSGNFGGTDYDIRGQVLTPAGAPEILSNGGGSFAAVSVAENQTAVTTIHAVDLEESALTYAIVGGVDSAKFAIDASTGVLTFVQARNFESRQDFGGNNVYDVVVSVSDGTHTDTQAIAVTITNVNEGVTLTGGQPSYLYIENGTAPVADFDATDADGDPVTYSLSGADSARFTIDSAGVLRFAASPDFEVRADAGANNIYDVTVTASDGSLSSSYTLSVEVLNRNEAPYIVSGGGGDSFALSVAENNGFVMTIVTADPDATPSSVTYSIVGGADASKFFIAQNGQLFFSSARNFEVPTDVGGNNVYDVIVSVSDGFNPADTQAIAVTVTNVNEAVTITSNGAGASANISIAENGLAVTTVTATDLDGTVPTYSIAGGADAALFTIDAATGALRFLAAPNFEAPGDAGANNVYNVTVAASDGSLTDTQALAVTVTGVNEDIVLAPVAAFSIGENQNAVGTIVASDPDGAALTYSIAGGADSGKFAINATTGALSFVSAPNFEAPGDAGGDNVYDVIVSASDGLFSRSQSVTVTIGNADEAVTIVSDGGGSSASLSVAENSLAVTTVAAIDPDGAPLTYAISGGADADRFTIDSATGALSFVATPDREAPGDSDGDNVYDVIVTASDGSFTDSQALAVAVGNVDEAVTIISGAGALSVSENGLAVSNIAAVDADGGPVSYSIAGGADSALFAIDSATGALSFITAPDHEAPGDSDGDNVYDVIVAASDGSFTDTRAVAVTVGNVNEGVTITSNGGGATEALTVAENGLAVTIVAATDADGTAPSYAIVGGADAGRFSIDPATGALGFISAPDFEAPDDVDGDNVYEVVVAASDGALSDSQALSVTVGNANESVTITSGGGGATASVSITENGQAVTDVVASDADGTAPSYAIAGGADSALFAIDSATGALRFLANPDFEAPGDADGDNVYEILVSASDGSFADNQAIAVTVVNANEGVTITSGGGGPAASLAVAENGLAVTIVAASDSDGTAPSYSIVGGADSDRFTIDSTTGALSFVAAPDFEAPADGDGDNVYEVTVSASDGSLADSQALAVTVQNVNDVAPVIGFWTDATIVMALAEGNGALIDVDATDGDGDSIVYSLAGADSASFTIDSATGAVSFLGAPDYESPGSAGGTNSYALTVVASDGLLSDTLGIVVHISNVNEAIAITSGAAYSVAENSSAAGIVTALDQDGTAPTYSIAGGADSALFTIDSATGALSFLSAPDFEAPGDAGADNVYDLIVSASDGSLSDSRAVSVTVVNSDEPLLFTSSNAVVRPENAEATYQVAAADPDGPGASIVYSIAGGADAACFSIDSATGLLTYIGIADHETPADADGDNVYEVDVQAGDGASLATQAIAFTISDVNEAPRIVSGGGGTSSSYGVNEGQTAIATIAAIDGEGSPVAYSITGGADAALFAIDSATGALRLIQAPDYEAPTDAFGDNFLTVVVSASDGTLSGWQLVQVMVGNVNEGLSITSGSVFSIAENGTFVATVAAADVDGTAPGFSIAGGADSALFSIDASTGALLFLAAPNFEAPGDSGGDNVYDVIVAASDGQFTDTRALAVTVTNANENVTITSGGGGSAASVSVAENGLAVTNVAAVDADGSAVTYSIVGGADSARFTIDAVTGALRFLAAPNFEAPADAGGNNVYDVVVAASDGSLTDSQALAVTVTNVNEGVTITSGGGGSSASVSVAENGLAVTNVAAVDADGTAVTYSIVGGADSARFTIDAVTGALRFLAAPNFEAPADAGGNNVYDVVVAASDGSFTDSQALAVSVTNVSEGVTITSGGGGSSASVSVAENGLAVTNVAAVDADGTAVTYSIAGGADSARFTIDAVTGALRFLTAPNFEAPADAGGNNVYDVVVAASDGSFTDSQALAVTVTNVNEGVTITSGGGGNSASFSITENSLGVTSLVAVDADGNAITYSIAGGADAARFTIDAATGALRFLVAPDFESPADADGNNVYDVVVAASDGSFTDSQALAVTVTNVNEGVTINSDGGGAAASVNVTENSLAVTSVAATDADGAPLIYAIAGGADAARFTIDSATGALRFISAPNFEAPTDVGGNNVYDVIVSASDGTFSDTQALAVTVNNVMEGNTIFGTSSNNTISTSASGSLRSTELDDIIYGMGGADTISGAGGGDFIDGGTGNDSITGGLGADQLIGGTGADTFIYTNVSESAPTARDLIMDFSRAEGDRISLTSIDANVNQGGNQNFSFIGSNAFSGVAGQLRFEIVNGHTFISADVNGDRVADFQIELNTSVPLIATDFLL